MQHQKIYVGKDFVPGTFPFQRQQRPIAGIQQLFYLFRTVMEHPLNQKDVFLFQGCAVHLSGPPYQVMSLVCQKQISARCVSFCKIPFQLYVRIKHIVIVADNGICPVGNVQTELKRADPILLCILKNDLPGYSKLLMNNVNYRVIYPIIMAFCLGSGVWIALCFFLETELFFGCNGHTF